MSYDLRRISLLAVVFLVLLRISIGWQFLYEGLWKYRTQSTGDAWTAQGYLLNAQGPFRPVFRSMVDDPDGLKWLDHDHMQAKWDRWAKRFAAHYQLDEAQKNRLDEILNGPKSYEVPLSSVPDAVRFDGSLGPRIDFRPGTEPDAKGALFIKKGQTLEEPHVRRLLGFVSERAEPEWHAAVNRLYELISTPAYKKRLANILLNDPDWTGKPLTDKDGNVIEERINRVEVYKARLDQYEQELAAADKSYDYVHLKKDWEEIQSLRKELVGPIENLETSLENDARQLLTSEQRARGPLPAEMTRIRKIDFLTMWTLMILGGLLIAGLGTRVAAFLGAGLVLSFYLVNPPWPGLPPQTGPEHSYIVDKNFIEVMALLALTFLPTGSWFGMDGMFRRLFRREKHQAAPGSEKKQPAQPVGAGK